MTHLGKNSLGLLLALACLTATMPLFAADADPRFVLQLGGVAFDPLATPEPMPDGWNHSAARGGRVEDFHLVQLDGPISDERLAALEGQGLEIVQYVHPHSYVVWGRRDLRDSVARADAVRWAGEFAPGFRLLPKWRDLGPERVEIRAVLYRGSDTDAVVRALASIGGTLTARSIVTEEFEVAGFTMQGDLLSIAATIPGVYSIQLPSDDGGSRAEVASQISAGNVDGGNVAQPGYQAWLTSVGLDGNGVVAGWVDEGVDEDHPDLLNHMLPCVGSTCAPSRSAHGTHTAGTFAGDATSLAMSESGFLSGLGTAPGAQLFEQDWRPHYQLPGGMFELIRQSWLNGAVLSNNSWGPASTPKGYNLDTLLVDAGVRDADPESPGNQPMIYVQAIANGNGGVSTQGAPDEAKNVFLIGSTHAVALPTGTPSTAIDDLSFTSAHGPALDGRTIPHMVAPGCYVESTVAFLPEGYVHEFRCGTSMAAAHVSGAVALFVEKYRGLPETSGDPSPALVKAAFMPVAHDLESHLDADLVPMAHRPGSQQGWGRMNLAAVVDPQQPVLYFDQATVLDFSGQEWARVVTQVDPAEPMRVMLVWTDAPGHGLGGNTPAWNNDLDLSVDADGQSYLGNDFGADGFSTTGGTADAMNNAEGVMLQSVTGSATIRVAATDINSNGVPHVGDRTDQDFALVCYNCALTPDFALSVDTSPLRVCAGTTGELDVEVAQLAAFGDEITLSTSGLPAGATADFSVNPVTPPATPVLTIDAGSAVDGDHTLEVQGDSLTLTRSVSLTLQLRTAPPAAAVLTVPADLAIDVEPQPVLSWDAVSWADRYLVEIATAPDFFEIVYSAVELQASHSVGRLLAQQEIYYWRVRGTNACGYGAVSPAASFTTRDVPDLLLVDDDYDLPNEQNEYTQALGGLGVSYDIWDVWAVHIGGEPSPADVAPYERIIWWSGQEEIFPGPDATSERDLPDWLDRGGCMLISSLDYVLAQSGVTEFMQERLGVGAVVEDTGMGAVTGAGTVFGALGTMTVANLNPDYRDTVSPDATAELAFSGDLGDAGINKDGGSYRTSFLGFGVESLGTANKPAVLGAFLSWCDGLGAVDGDGDGVANESDCVAGDANVWGAPQAITDLMLDKSSPGFAWSQPVSGAGSRYDVLRSVDPTDFYNATCAFAGGSQTVAPADPAEPEPDQLFFYLVGAQSDCGLSTLGNNLDGTPRYGTACDAEAQWW